jgi:hypothetical protein
MYNALLGTSTHIKDEKKMHNVSPILNYLE